MGFAVMSALQGASCAMQARPMVLSPRALLPQQRLAARARTPTFSPAPLVTSSMCLRASSDIGGQAPLVSAQKGRRPIVEKGARATSWCFRNDALSIPHLRSKQCYAHWRRCCFAPRPGQSVAAHVRPPCVPKVRDRGHRRPPADCGGGALVRGQPPQGTRVVVLEWNNSVELGS